MTTTAAASTNMNINIVVNTSFACPTYLGLPAVAVAELWIAEYSATATWSSSTTTPTPVNKDCAIASDGKSLHGSLVKLSTSPTLVAGTSTTMATQTGGISIDLKPSYFVGLFAKQLVSGTATPAVYQYHLWYSTGYDLSLNPDTGVMTFQMKAPEGLAGADTLELVGTTAGTAALTNSLTTNYARIANLKGDLVDGEKTAAYVASCAGIVQDEATTGYAPTTQTTASIGACADACTTSATTEALVNGGCHIFQYDSSLATNNCKLYRSALNTQSVADAQKATASTNTQCWATKAMINASRDTDCVPLGSYYGFTDTGCKRRLMNAPTNASGAPTSTSQPRTDVTVLSQEAYCARFSLVKDVCDDTTGCKWTGTACKPKSATCDRGHYDTTTDRMSCTACAAGFTTDPTAPATRDSTLCKACSTQTTDCPVTKYKSANQAGQCAHSGVACMAIGGACSDNNKWFKQATNSYKCEKTLPQQCEKVGSASQTKANAYTVCQRAGLREHCRETDRKCYCRYRDGSHCSTLQIRPNQDLWS